jgi:hypothetical protein
MFKYNLDGMSASKAGLQEIEAIYNDGVLANDKAFSGIAGNAVKLLGQGLDVGIVAHTLGCDESYISQLLAQDEFKKQVTVMKMDLLQDATNRDRRLDKIEDKIIDKVERDLESNPFAFKSTSDAIRHLSIINGLKRRGAGADLGVMQNQGGVTVVKLTLAKHVNMRFEAQVDANNQVIQVGEQAMITVASSTLSASMQTKSSDAVGKIPGIINAGKADRLSMYE